MLVLKWYWCYIGALPILALIHLHFLGSVMENLSNSSSSCLLRPCTVVIRKFNRRSITQRPSSIYWFVLFKVTSNTVYVAIWWLFIGKYSWIVHLITINIFIQFGWVLVQKLTWKKQHIRYDICQATPTTYLLYSTHFLLHSYIGWMMECFQFQTCVLIKAKGQ